MRISSVFSYYGGKSKIANAYPAPKHGLIVEPFAGAAAYAWAHHEKDVWLNELDPRTFSIWKFLTSEDALEWVEAVVPSSPHVGTRVSDLCDVVGCPSGLVELMRAEANRGTQGKHDVNDSITSMAASCWPRFLPKMREVIPAIAHWEITNYSYADMPTDLKATWFVDPPYANAAGRKYRQSSIDYTHLGTWCASLSGQIIVCENEGASWLPFVPFEHRRVQIRSRYQKSEAREVVWIKDDTNVGIPVATVLGD